MGKQSAERCTSSSLSKSGAGLPRLCHHAKTGSARARSEPVIPVSPHKTFRSENPSCRSSAAPEPYRITDTSRSLCACCNRSTSSASSSCICFHQLLDAPPPPEPPPPNPPNPPPPDPESKPPNPPRPQRSPWLAPPIRLPRIMP